METAEKVTNTLKDIKCIGKALCLAVIVLLLLGGVSFGQNAKVLIISGDQQKSTNRSVKGIKQTIASSSIQADVDFFMLNSGQSGVDSLDSFIRKFSPDVLVTVGTRCTKITRGLGHAIPIVFASVLNPVTSGFAQEHGYPQPGVTGASLDIDVGLQLDRFKKLVPNLKKVGILYSERTMHIVEQASNWSDRHEIELVKYEVKSAKDVPKGVETLTHSCDGLWAIPDDLIYTPQSTKHILLESFRTKIPIMGFSPSFVKSGALFALIVDHKFVGVQAGEMVVKILAGTPIERLAISTPEAPYLYINKKTADRLRLDIAQDYYMVAKEVYE